MAIRSGRFGYSFTILRVLQLLCFVPLVGLCIVFATEVTRLGGATQPAPVVLVIVVVGTRGKKKGGESLCLWGRGGGGVGTYSY